MSSTAKGDEFEAQFFELLKSEVSAGNLFAAPERCKFFRKKGYRSNARKKKIIFDISIEICLPGSSKYFILILVECKNHGRPVSVDEAEEFWAKIKQISDTGIKGVIASKSSFAQGTFNFCKAIGIALARYYDLSTLKWELLRSPSSVAFSTPDWTDIRTGLLSEAHRSRYFDLYCYSGGVHTYSIHTFLRNLLGEFVHDPSMFVSAEALAKIQPPLVERILPQQIESMVESVLTQIGYSGGAVSLNDVCHWLTKKYNLCVKTVAGSMATEGTNPVLGRIAFQPLEITVVSYHGDARGRQRFTLAHELGHYLLGHERYMTGEYYEEADIDGVVASGLGLDDIDRMEWQANQFASCLLLPRKHFIRDCYSAAEECDLKNRGHGFLFVDHQMCNAHNFYFMTNLLRLKYDVSRRAVALRLKRLGLLNDTRQDNRMHKL